MIHDRSKAIIFKTYLSEAGIEVNERMCMGVCARVCVLFECFLVSFLMVCPFTSKDIVAIYAKTDAMQS